MRRARSHAWRRSISSLGLIVLLTRANGMTETEPVLNEDDLKIPIWNFSTELRGGFGYKDNVLLSHTNEQGSAFWVSGAEAMIFRLPTHGWHFHFFADATDARYFDAPTVDNEQVALAASELGKEFGRGWKTMLGLNYLFQNQVFDFSNLYTNQASVGQALGHTLTPRWAVRKAAGPFWIETEFSGTRQWLDQPLDDYWQFGPRAALGRSWNRGSEVGLSYQFLRLNYDTREQVDEAGGALADTSLAFTSHAADLTLTYVWDEKRRWQTVTSLGYEVNLDNGSGFYDYDQYRLSQQLRYRSEKWQITARARVSYFDYSIQTISATDTALRRKTMLNLMLRVERKVARHLTARASYVWDRSFSNLDFDDYEAGTVLGELALTF